MNILLLEPYFTGSHQAWAEGYAKHSQHEVEILSLPGHFWKWRMHGGAISLARNFMESSSRPDLILATDMLDLTTFLSLTRARTADIPTALYFHENQLTYPWSEIDRDIQKNRDHHYGFINFASALAADVVFFNSRYHLESFLSELPRFLKQFPDHREMQAVQEIRAKSEVLPLGLDLRRFDEHKRTEATKRRDRPLLLWNHRWEYDKNPDEFFQALFQLADNGLDFELAVMGECFSQTPEVFTAAKERLGERVVQFGFAESFAGYSSWLWRADILPVTSHQDFFGASVVEALYCECFPILPNRLAYPELIPEGLHSRHFYENFEGLVRKLERAIVEWESPGTEKTREAAGVFAWQRLVGTYDRKFEDLVKRGGHARGLGGS
jgi:glycosyltransferase involved in cell wall biosynthesis